jgi:uncharacterized protein YndB with AHSA1/START domain
VSAISPVPAVIEFSGLVKRPVAEVFAFLANAENQSKWSSEGSQYQRTTKGPIGAGTTFRFTGKFMGRRLDGTREITDYRPNTTFAFKNTQPIAFEGRYAFEPVGGGTKITFTAEGKVSGFYKWIMPVFIGMTRRLFLRDFENLKKFLEGQVAA